MGFIDYHSDLNLEILKEFIDNHDDFYLFGADGDGEFCCRWLKGKSKNVIAYIDNDFKKQGKVLGDLEILSLDELKISKEKIIITSIHADEIAIQLESKGYKLGEHYISYDNLYWIDEPQFYNSVGSLFYDAFKKDEVYFNQVIDILGDQYSKEIFYRVVNYRLTSLNPTVRLKSHLPIPFRSHQMKSVSQKCVLEEFNCAHNYPNSIEEMLIKSLINRSYVYRGIERNQVYKTIMDIGGYIGDTACYFAYKYRDATIYSFEPTFKGFESIQKLKEYFNNIIPVKVGLGKEYGFFSFDENEQNIESSRLGTGNKFIEVTTLDKFSEQNNINKVDLIKMDIEGSELDALYGSKLIIERDKPDLAICIYHSPKDLWQIPLWIKQNFPEYNIYIDHTDGMFVWGTVCFASIKGV